MPFFRKYLAFLILFFVSWTVYAQGDSSLLERIKNIDVSLNSTQYEEENLYVPDVSFQSFYDELSPYGEWIQLSKEEIEKDLKDGEGQGISLSGVQDEELLFIWKPSAVEKNWKPYVNGRWEYTDHGWLWASNYDWGWAAYHYGRWYHSKTYGWVWMPGYVWAPSWVAWKVTDDHIGWHPLSPAAKWKGEDGITDSRLKFRDEDWVFIEKTKFGDDVTVSDIKVLSENNNLLSRSTTIIDLRVQNGKVFNNGPDINDIVKSGGRPIRQKIVKTAADRRKTIVLENDVTVYKQSLPKASIDSKTGRPVRKDKPNKFKRSERLKKIFKQKRQHRLPPHRK